MRKLVLGLIATVMFSFVGNAQTPSNEEVWKMLKSKFDYERVDFKNDESKNGDLLNSLRSNSFISSSVSISELNLSNVTEMYHKDGVKSLFIPFVKNSKYTLLISIKGNDYKTILKTVIEKNDVNSQGNGNINIITPNESFENTFLDGKNTTVVSGKKSCFRTCFDNAYDDICDGFIGCAAWYTNPGVPLVAAAYCELKC